MIRYRLLLPALLVGLVVGVAGALGVVRTRRPAADMTVSPAASSGPALQVRRITPSPAASPQLESRSTVTAAAVVPAPPPSATASASPATVPPTAAAPLPSASVAAAISRPTSVQRQGGDPVERLLAEMSIEEKIGQMVMFGFSGREVTPGLRDLITTAHAGNLILLPENAGRPEQVLALTSAYQRIARDANHGISMLVAADQEGGSRITLADGFTAWPRNAAVGETGSAAYAAQIADGIAREMRAVGLNMNLAPVMDVNDNPANPVIGWRSYGPDPRLVADLGAAAIHAYQDDGVIPTAKHFPGHGNTSQDSHTSRPVVTRSLDVLNQIELVPFRRAVAAGVDVIMTAHVLYPALDPDRPATLSPAILTGLLREQMGFQGVIITDDFTMVGVLEGYGAGPAAVLAVQAGADMVMVVAPESRQREVYAALLGAVQDGTISTDRIDASVRRILQLKQRYGLLD